MHLFRYLSVLIIITVILLLIYACVQQVYRTTANDPQIQIAHHMQSLIMKGERPHPDSLHRVDLENDLSVFTATYDADGHPLEADARLHGKLPALPAGVFSSALKNGENSVTWQPENNVRMAMVILPVQDRDIKFVAVGRSLRETEARIASLIKMVVLCWILCFSILLLNFLTGKYFS